jgi:hypothetical protein
MQNVPHITQYCKFTEREIMNRSLSLFFRKIEMKKKKINAIYILFLLF